MLIRPAKALRGEVALPGDKSISHRAAMIAAIAEGETRIENFATSADCASTLECVRLLGVEVRREGSTVWINGRGIRGLGAPSGPLDCGNSGTTMRLLAGILAGQEFDSVLVGDESLQKRPMQRIAEPLRAMGASVETTDGHPPVRIFGGRSLKPVEHELQVASAQVKSCLLLAGLYAHGATSVLESSPTRDHTERMLRKFGIPVQTEHVNGTEFKHTLTGNTEMRPCVLTVPADISAAAFFMVGAACLDGSEVIMRNVGLGTNRSGVLGVLMRCGASIENHLKIENARAPYEQPEDEPVGDICVSGGFGPSVDETGPSIRIGMPQIPSLIDEIPVLAILGSQCEDGMEVRDAAELRVKETDRIAAVVENLRRMGADIEEFHDGFRIGRSQLRGAKIDSFGDHRIAMAFAIAGLLVDKGETEIVGAECVDVSFPGFFDVLEDVVIYE